MTLLPSATEIVCALGLQENLVGVSHDCDYPPGVETLPAMTSTGVPHNGASDEIDTYVRRQVAQDAVLYDLDLPALAAAAPDVIVSQTLCEVCAVSTGDVIKAIETLPSKPVLIDLDPKSLDEVLDDGIKVGALLGCESKADALSEALRFRKFAVARRTAQISPTDRPRLAFLEWLMPPFVGGHWIPEIVALAGGTDVFGAPRKPSFTLRWEQVAAAQPDILFVACCGFSKERALEDIRTVMKQDVCRRMPAVDAGKVLLADGNAYFSRPGPRLVDGLEMMAHALHPEIHPPSVRGSCEWVAL